MKYGSVAYRLRMSVRQHRALWSIVGVNVGVALLCWIVQIVCGLAGHPVYLQQWIEMPASAAAFIHSPWTAVTYMFAPTGVINLLFNMLWLWWFGLVLDEAAGNRRLWLTYLCGGLGGAAFCLALTALAPSLGGSTLAGPSAALVAVMVYAALLRPNLEFRLLLIGSVKLKWLAVVSLALLLLGLGGSANAGGQAAHLGGAAAGLSIWLAYRSRRQRRRPSAPRPAAKKAAKAASVAQARVKAAPKISKAMAEYRTDMQRLDALLDKIKLSGYDSLSAREKDELQELSQRIPTRPGSPGTTHNSPTDADR